VQQHLVVSRKLRIRVSDCTPAVGTMQRAAARSSSLAAGLLLISVLLSSSDGAFCARTGSHLTTAEQLGRQLRQTAADVQAAAAGIVSFTPAPITGIAAVEDQAVGTGAAEAPAVLPNFGIPSPEPLPEVVPSVILASAPGPATETDAEAWAQPWSCGEADANCRARSELAAVGATAIYDITVAVGNVDDMVIIANSTDGHVDL
jgi:hypothetical protein